MLMRAPIPSPLVQLRHASPLGPIRLLAGPGGLAGLWFEDQKYRPVELDGLWPHQPKHPCLQQAQQELDEYFQGRRQRFDLPLDLSAGTGFQQLVGRALLNIGHGHTRSYAEVAAALGRPRAARAVGLAVGRNRLSIIVPCHRVWGSRGALTGYAGGLERKRHLLALEGSL
ncbi:MAG: methylated-DNA--[protein]-cysteine S-methyltransferase [Betaproteobacteria bacterium]